jgi:hypothetical protein
MKETDAKSDSDRKALVERLNQKGNVYNRWGSHWKDGMIDV